MRKEMEQVLSGHASAPLKLAPEIEAEKAAEKAAQKQKQMWGNALKGAAPPGGEVPQPHPDQRSQQSKSAARRQRSRERTQAEQEKAAAAGATQGQPPASGAASAVKPGERFFLSAKGEKLPWLDEAEIKRCGKGCYYYQFGKCNLTPEECKEKYGK